MVSHRVQSHFHVGPSKSMNPLSIPKACRASKDQPVDIKIIPVMGLYLTTGPKLKEEKHMRGKNRETKTPSKIASYVYKVT